MGDAYIHRRGGGAPLNFKVVGGTSAPSNPKENTIWINTNVPISDWAFGYFPNPSWYMAEGWVYIHAATSDANRLDFNVLKKNGIWIQPFYVKQYVGGVWVLKEAKIYQGGNWLDLIFQIIGNGADGLGITGGFTSNYENQWAFQTDGSLKLYRDGGNAYSSEHVPSKRTIDVTNYTTMTIKVSSFSRYPSFIGVNAPGNTGNSSSCKVQIVSAGTYTLDVSGVSGAVHIQVDFDYNGTDMVVSELYFS